MSSFLQTSYQTATNIQSDNPDLIRRGRLLNTVIVGVVLVAVLFIPLALLNWRGMPTLITVAIIAAGLLMSLAALQISRRADPRAAAYLFLGTFWVVITTIMLFLQSDAAAAFAFLPYMYAVPVIVAGVTISRWAPFGFLAAGILALLAIPLVYPPAELLVRDAGGQVVDQGQLPVVVYVARDAIYLTLLALCSFLFERTLAGALQETRRRATSQAEQRVGVVQHQREEHLAGTIRQQATDLALTVQQQSTSRGQQEMAVQAVTATVEELAATAREISFSAHNVSEIAARVLHSVEQGQVSLETTSDSVAYLGERVTAIGERVQAVDAHVSQIREIADLLTEVGDNIHLLALNATIEAAGAGPYGERFAVVAREVQELADHVRQASEQVQSQVLDIQTATASALVSTKAGQEAAESAIIQTNETRAVHLQIHHTAEQASALAEQIALGTDQQQSASAQVLETLRGVRQSVQALVEGSTRVATAATQLSGLAGELGAAPPAEYDVPSTAYQLPAANYQVS